MDAGQRIEMNIGVGIYDVNGADEKMLQAFEGKLPKSTEQIVRVFNNDAEDSSSSGGGLQFDSSDDEK